MSKKLLKILGGILAFIISFLLNNLHEVFPSFLTSIFSPVNDSFFEFMKVLFGCIVFSGVIQKIIVLVKKEKINNICLSNFLGALASIPIFLFLSLPFYYFIGFDTFVKIFVLLITIILSEYISYRIMNMKDFKFENKTIFMVIAIYLFFVIFTHL